MAMVPDVFRNLPASARSALQGTDLTPTVLRAKFGPRIRFDSDNEDDAYAPEPQTELGKQLAAHAERCQRTWTQIHAAHARSLADKSVDHTTAFLRSAKSAKRHLADLDAEAERLMNQVDVRSKWLGDRMAEARKPPASVGDAQVDAEVRAMIRAEKNPAKAAALGMEHPRAVATAPALVVGWVGKDGKPSDAYRAHVAAHLTATIPDVMGEAAELSDALERFTRANGSLESLTRQIIDFDLADKLHSGGQWDAA